jgi:hypothetical protein
MDFFVVFYCYRFIFYLAELVPCQRHLIMTLGRFIVVDRSVYLDSVKNPPPGS